MTYQLSGDQRRWQLEARRFAEQEIRPVALARDRIADPRETIDWSIIEKGSRLGFRTAAVPRALGGHGLDFLTQAVVIAELARGDSAIAKTFSQCWKWCHLVVDRGTAEQRRRFLAPFLADDGYLLGGGITEPNAGSDNRLPPSDPRAGLRLGARRDGADWVLNGEKCYIANANVGKLIFVYARTDPDAPVTDGTSIFAVERGTPGLSIGKVFNKSGWRFYQNAELVFTDVRVPAANLLGEVNSGLRARPGGSNERFSELEYPANALGVCDAATQMATARARAQRQSGRPLSDQQLIQLKLCDMHMLTEALRSYVLRLAAGSDADLARPAPHGHFLVNYSSEVIQRVCEANLEIHAAAGVDAGLAAADKLARDAFIWTHIAGDSVMRMRSLRGHLDEALPA
jgi:acyl-CoA dehydrogenase